MLTFEHDAGAREYRATMNGQRAGLLRYRPEGDVLHLEHTETAPDFQGQGVAGDLMRFVLEDVRARSLRIVPECSYAAGWVERHPEFADLVAGA